MDRSEFAKAMVHVVRIISYFAPREKKFYLSILFKETQKVSRELIEKIFLGFGIADPASTLEVDMNNDGSCEAKCENNNEFLFLFDFFKDRPVPFNCGFLANITKETPFKFIWVVGSAGKKDTFATVYSLDLNQRQLLSSENNRKMRTDFFSFVQSVRLTLNSEWGVQEVPLSFKSTTLTCEGLVVKYEEGE